MDTIDQMRRQIADLQHERQAILRQQRSRDEVKGSIDAWLAAVEQQGRDALHLACERAAAGQVFTPCHVHGNAAVFEAPGAAPVSLDLAPLLVAMLGRPMIKKALAVFVDELPEGMAPQDKARRLVEIDSELYRLEVAEEAAIVDAEQQGAAVLRRADARPGIVLA